MTQLYDDPCAACPHLRARHSLIGDGGQRACAEGYRPGIPSHYGCGCMQFIALKAEPA